MREVSLENLRFRRVYKFVIYDNAELTGNIVTVKDNMIYIDSSYHDEEFAFIQGFHIDGINHVYLNNEIPIKKDYKNIEANCEMHYPKEVVPNGYIVYESCEVEGLNTGCIYEFLYKNMTIRGKVISVNSNDSDGKMYVLCDMAYNEKKIWLYVLLDYSFLTDFEIQDEIPIYKIENFDEDIRVL